MIVQLGNIVLDEYLILDGIETSLDVSVSTVTTLGGISVSTTMPILGGRLLSLVSALDGGTLRSRFFRSQVMEIKELAALGMEVPLVHPMGNFNVVIISTADLVPFKNYRNPQDDSVYTGPIQLQEV